MKKGQILVREVVATVASKSTTEEIMNYYAEIDATNTVTHVFTSEHDAGHPEVRMHFEGRGNQGTCVYVEEPCIVGDRLIVDEDMCAEVNRDDSDDVDPEDVDWVHVADSDEIVRAVTHDGWVADDGNQEVEYSLASSGREAAEEYVEDGDWGDAEPITAYIDVWAWRTVTGFREDGSTVLGMLDRECYSIAIEPDEPKCDGEHDHDWCSPVEVVGGIEENPGCWGNGGGVVVREVCRHCGKYRVTDTWDQSQGPEPVTTVTYEDSDEASLEWIENNSAA